jgi:hypothetical protein
MASFIQGQGRQVKSSAEIVVGDVVLDFGALTASTRIEVTFTLPGARPNDLIFVAPQVQINDDLVIVGARVSANDTVTVTGYAGAGATGNPGEELYRYVWFSTNR